MKIEGSTCFNARLQCGGKPSEIACLFPVGVRPDARAQIRHLHGKVMQLCSCMLTFQTLPPPSAVPSRAVPCLIYRGSSSRLLPFLYKSLATVQHLHSLAPLLSPENLKSFLAIPLVYHSILHNCMHFIYYYDYFYTTTTSKL